MKKYNILLDPAAPSQTDAGAPPAADNSPGIVASIPGEGAFSRGADGEMTFNEGGLPSGVTPPAPNPLPSGIANKTTVVKPSNDVQSPSAKEEFKGSEFDAFEAVKDGKPLDKVKTPPSDATKPLSTPPAKEVVEPAKTEPAKAESTVKPAQDKPVTKEAFKFDPFKGKQTSSAQPTITQPQARDYSGLEPQEQEIFKKMGNEAFDMLKPIYLQHKQTKANPPQPAQHLNIFEHQEAYTLTPEYKEAVHFYQRANYETSHWQQQLAKLRSGEKWNDIAIDPKSGQYINGPEYDATPQGEAHIIANMTKTSQIATQAQGTLQNIGQQFGNFYQQSVRAIKDAESKFFPFYENTDNPHKEQIKAILEAIPAPLRNTPLASMLAKAGSAYKETLRQLEEAHERIAQLEGKQQEQHLVQGNQRSMGASSANGVKKGANNTDDIFAAFEMAKAS